MPTALGPQGSPRGSAGLNSRPSGTTESLSLASLTAQRRSLVKEFCCRRTRVLAGALPSLPQERVKCDPELGTREQLPSRERTKSRRTASRGVAAPGGRGQQEAARLLALQGTSLRARVVTKLEPE
ncbi:hypothetical protein H920_10821 [Fukomys damarensis]|uniref:Uncharacterized protein n=1 Tax=Fukomys damarensis TaxID=885580 RepID=A0A091DYC1_FUKDA|nr:hypothetical protein H920_10821 [Fukomys damarensis]